MEILPVINCHFGDKECVLQKLKIAGSFSEWIHLDVEDAKFTFGKTWGSPEELSELTSRTSKEFPNLKWEAHLMVEEPDRQAEAWLKSGAKRLVLHVETITQNSADSMLALARKYGAEIMLSSNPSTSFLAIEPYLKKFSQFQVLAVNPGLAGQKFLPAVLEKIKSLRQAKPDDRIEVDGGINLETGRLAKEAGADAFVSSTYIFGDKEPRKAYAELKNL